MSRQQSTSTHRLVWLNWPKETSGMERRELQMPQTIFETWDDSDGITAVNAQKDLRHPAK